MFDDDLFIKEVCMGWWRRFAVCGVFCMLMALGGSAIIGRMVNESSVFMLVCLVANFIGWLMFVVGIYVDDAVIWRRFCEENDC